MSKRSPCFGSLCAGAAALRPGRGLMVWRPTWHGRDGPTVPLGWTQLMSKDTQRQVQLLRLGHLEGVLPPVRLSLSLGRFQMPPEPSPSLR